MSVVKHEDVLDPANPGIGSECTVKVANRTYQGRLAAVGKYTVQLLHVLHILYVLSQSRNLTSSISGQFYSVVQKLAD